MEKQGKINRDGKSVQEQEHSSTPSHHSPSLLHNTHTHHVTCRLQVRSMDARPQSEVVCWWNEPTTCVKNDVTHATWKEEGNPGLATVGGAAYALLEHGGCSSLSTSSPIEQDPPGGSHSARIIRDGGARCSGSRGEKVRVASSSVYKD